MKNIIFDPTIARGLDYYTGLIYEVVYDNEDIISTTIAAGGRYDNLIGKLTKKNVPAIGVSFGIERIVTILEKTNKLKLKENCLINNDYLIENQDVFYQDNFSFDAVKFQAAFEKFSQQSFSLLTKNLLIHINQLSLVEEQIIEQFPISDFENELLKDRTILEALLGVDKGSFNSCTQAFRPAVSSRYKQYFITNNLRTLNVNDFINYQLKLLCEKVTFIESSDQVESLIKEKDFLDKSKDQLKSFEDSLDKSTNFYFSEVEYKKNCFKRGELLLANLPQTLANICKKVWRDKYTQQINELIQLIECGLSCSQELKQNSQYIELSGRIDLFINDKISKASTVCESDKACIKENVFKNTNKDAFASEFTSHLDTRLESFMKTQFYKKFFIKSIKY
jgi:ASC-1-like (ASCH) protein